MRLIRYAVSMSLDGYIAGPNGDYDWIPTDPDIDFPALMARFDTFLMGRKTFEAAAGGPSFDGDVWVVSRTLRPEDHPEVTVVGDRLGERLRQLRSRPGKEIALFGGGGLFRSLLALDEIDAVEVAVIPVLLGGGIPILPAPAERRKLKLRNQRLYPRTGTLVLDYEVVRS